MGENVRGIRIARRPLQRFCTKEKHLKKEGEGCFSFISEKAREERLKGERWKADEKCDKEKIIHLSPELHVGAAKVWSFHEALTSKCERKSSA